MSHKSRGINAERDLVHKLQEKQFAAIRIAGSGNTKEPSTDILAGNGMRLLSIECKTVKGKYRYLSHEQITDFQSFSHKFGAESWIAVRFFRKPWIFLRPEDLHKTPSQYCISQDIADKYGLLLDDIVK